MGETFEVIFFWIRPVPGGCFFFYKKCREFLENPIYLIRRAYLDRSENYDIYKSANAAPIHKGNSIG